MLLPDVLLLPLLRLRLLLLLLLGARSSTSFSLQAAGASILLLPLCPCCMPSFLTALLLAGGPTHSVPRQLQAQLLCAGGPAMLLQLRLCLRPDQLRQRIYLRV